MAEAWEKLSAASFQRGAPDDALIKGQRSENQKHEEAPVTAIL
jgi:hypothetical protein